MSLVISVWGAEGKMGKSLLKLGRNSSDFEVNSSLNELTCVVVDFSSPKGAIEVAEWCLKNKKALVTGTTGLSDEQTKKLSESAEVIPILSSANFSIGLNAMAKSVRAFTESFRGQKIEIEETHHTKKKDAPSGTAKFLHNLISESADKDVLIPAPVSLREGEVFGIHKVTFSFEGEKVTFIHEAENREIFARGALQAARWIEKKAPGVYSMSDMLDES